MKKMLKCWLQALVELIMFFPVFLVPAYLMFDSYLWIVWLLGVTVSFMFGYAVTKLLNSQVVVINFIAILLPIIILSIILFSTPYSILGSIVAFGFAGLRGYSYFTKDGNKHFPLIAYWSGIILYVFAYVLVLFFDREQQYPFIDYITIMGIVAMLLTLILGNSKILSDEHKAKKGTKARTATQMLVQNRVFIGLFFVMCMGFASIGAIAALFSSIGDRFKEWLSQFTGMQFGDPADNIVIDDGQGAGLDNKGSGIFQNLDTWIFYFVVFALIIGFILLIYVIIKKLPKIIEAFKNLMSKKRGTGTAEEEDLGYVDEEENLLDLKKSAKKFMNRFTNMFKRDERLSDFETNAEKIRFIYRFQILKALQKGYDFKSQLTPVETANDISTWNTEYKPVEDLIQAYNRTRYGKQQLDNDIVEKLKNHSGIKEK